MAEPEENERGIKRKGAGSLSGFPPYVITKTTLRANPD